MIVYGGQEEKIDASERFSQVQNLLRACADDFLRGEEPYKYLWGATDRPQYRIWMSPDAERLPSPPERIQKTG